MLAALLPGGCAQQGVYHDYLQLIRQGASDAFGDHAVTREEAAAIPYASLGYRIDGGPQRILALATDENGSRLWTSAQHIVLVTQDGRLTRGVGLAHDFSIQPSQTVGALPAPSAAFKAPYASSRSEDFPDMGSYAVPVQCNTAMVGPESVTILGQAISTIRVDETCRSESLGWSFVDSYWLDPQSGLAWRSLQHPNPKIGAVDIEIFRPPT